MSKIILSSIADVQHGQSPESSYYSDIQGVPFLQGNRTFGNLFPFFDTYTSKVTRLAKKGDILMSVRAPVGDLNIAPCDLCIGRGLASLHAKNGDNVFLYYALKYNVNNLIKQGAATTYDSVNKDIINNFCLIIPEHESERNFVGQILGFLDSKIELNNKINSELEALAKTIYDYWFVQFDFPDENGKPYKSSGGKMVWNEELKREIPKSWDAGGFDDLADVVGGSTPSTSNELYFTKNGVPWITPKDLSLNLEKKFISKGEIDITELGLRSASLKELPKGTVLLSSRAPIGYIAISRNLVTTNQGFKSLIPKTLFSTEYVYFTVKLYVNTMMQYASGSTFSEISASTLKMIKIPLPNKELVKKFTENVESIFSQQDILEQENDQLVKLRDWLLPMLMNGQVKIK
jgi:type I restriction enzyme S subunit